MNSSAQNKPPFSEDLQRRAAEFLQRPIPPELQPTYAPGSLAEVIITCCAQAQPLDPELREIGEICTSEYDQAIAEARTPELKTYYSECQQLVGEIIS